MIKHAFMKNMTDTVRKSYEKAFQKLEPVSIMRPSKFELPLTSIRRILGDKFYTMKDTSDDVLSLTIYDEGIYSVEDLNLQLKEELNLQISSVQYSMMGLLKVQDIKSLYQKTFVTRRLQNFVLLQNQKVLKLLKFH